MIARYDAQMSARARQMLMCRAERNTRRVFSLSEDARLLMPLIIFTLRRLMFAIAAIDFRHTLFATTPHAAIRYAMLFTPALHCVSAYADAAR